MELKVLAKQKDNNRINIKNDGNETAEEAKSDNDISTKLLIAKYESIFFQTWDRNSVSVRVCDTRCV